MVYAPRQVPSVSAMMSPILCDEETGNFPPFSGVQL